MAKSYRRIKSVGTAMDILEYLADARAAVPGTQVAHDMGIPFGTVMSHLATLADGAYVQQIGDGYKIGMKLAVFWARMKAMKENEIQNAENDLKQLGA